MPFIKSKSLYIYEKLQQSIVALVFIYMKTLLAYEKAITYYFNKVDNVFFIGIMMVIVQNNFMSRLKPLNFPCAWMVENSGILQ